MTTCRPRAVPGEELLGESRPERVGNDAPLRLPAEVFDTPELRQALAESILQGPGEVPLDLKRGFAASQSKWIDEQQPSLREALRTDVTLSLNCRGEIDVIDSRLDLIRVTIRLGWMSDAFLGLLLYRMRTVLRVRRVPILPRLLHRLCMMCFQICIGDPVILRPGVYFPHGQVVIDGRTEIGSGTSIAPWVTIGLREGEIAGPTIGRDVFIGTGSKIIGPVHVGDGARIAANSVVIDEVPPNSTVGGVPARILSDRRSVSPGPSGARRR
jgi:serine O-acetyltransferase